MGFDPGSEKNSAWNVQESFMLHVCSEQTTKPIMLPLYCALTRLKISNGCMEKKKENTSRSNSHMWRQSTNADHRDQYWTVLNYSCGHRWPERGNRRDQQEDWEWMWAQKGCPSLSVMKGSMKTRSVKTPKKQRKPQVLTVTVKSSFHVKMYQTSTPNAEAGRLPWVWGHLGYKAWV